MSYEEVKIQWKEAIAFLFFIALLNNGLELGQHGRESLGG